MNLRHRFAYHPPSGDDIKARHERVRQILGDAAAELSEVLDNRTRETDRAMAALEEAMFWSNADIARNQNGSGVES